MRFKFEREPGIRGWLWGKVEGVWDRAFQKFILKDLIAHGCLFQTHEAQRQAKADDLAVMTALMFALEALARSPDQIIATRAQKHLTNVALARLRQHRMDWLRELPPEAAAA